MSMSKMIAVAVVAASAMAANAATPITNTINGVEWRFMLDTPTGSEGTAMLGINPDTSGKTNRGKDDMHGCSKNVSVNAAAGVYMIRLVNGDSVKVQKVVVR